MRPVVVPIVAAFVVGSTFSAGDRGGNSREKPRPGDARVYYGLVTVGCAPPVRDQVVFGWRTEAEGVDPSEATRVFKYLAAPDVEDCLSRIVKTEPGLHDALLQLGPEASAAKSRQVVSRVRRVWSRYGVAEAIAEVAKTGRRGPRVDALLQSCQRLSSVPVQPR